MTVRETMTSRRKKMMMMKDRFHLRVKVPATMDQKMNGRE